MTRKKTRLAFLCCIVSCSKGQESTSWPCAVNGAAYGNINHAVQQWAPLVGKACANSVPNTCFSDAIEWSSIALEYGNRPVSTLEECAYLCSQVDACEVWTYWPSGTDDEHKPKCDLCPISLGGSFDWEQDYCSSDGCSVCGELYDLNAAQGIPHDAEYSCEDARLWFEQTIGCCKYDQQTMAAYLAPATCELYRAAPNHAHVLAYGLDAITGPKDCSSTVWLPFLEPIVEEDPLEPVVVNHTLKGYCDMCPEEYGFLLLPTKQVCYDDDSCGFCLDSYNAVKDGLIENGNNCETNTQWFTTSAGCCVVPENPVLASTSNTTNTSPADFPSASDGRLCWVDSTSYGSAKDGACAEADIIAVYTHPETIELGRNQGWWKSPITGQAIEPAPYDGEPYTVLDCYQACIDNARCGGWQFQGKSCILKTTLDCSPTIARTSLMNVTAGISGCVDLSSDNTAENSAVDTSSLWFFDCTRPRCTQPYSYGGRWTDDTYIPDLNHQDACWYKQYKPDELFGDCLQDRWIVINGGSNSLSFFIQMVNLFAPLQRMGDLEPLIDFGYDDGVNLYPMIDIVFRRDSLPILNRTSDGILHFNKKRFCDVDTFLPCYTTSLVLPDGQVDWPPAYGAALDRFLADAPYEAGATRLTLVVGQFWSAATEALRAVVSVPQNTVWATSSVLFYGQAMHWYSCNVHGWCDIPALGYSNEEMLSKYQSDLDDLLVAGKDICDSDRVDCFFATGVYGTSPGTLEKTMIEALEEIAAPYNWANFIDYNGFLFDEEIVSGHLMPSMFLPVFAMLWNTVCDGPAVGCPQAISSSPNCWANCNDRQEDSGEACPSCFDSWECANEIQCDAQVLDPVPWQVATSITSSFRPGEQADACFAKQEVNVQQRSEEGSGNEGQYGTNSCQNRIWCGTLVQGWVVSVLVFLAGIAVIAYAQYRSIQAKKKEEEETTNARNSVVCEKSIALPSVPLYFGGESPSTTSNSVTEDEKSLTTRGVSSRSGSMTQRSSNSFNYIASVGEDGAVVISLSHSKKSPASKVSSMSASSSETPDRFRSSGPSCVDDFVDSSFARDRKGHAKSPVSNVDIMSVASSEAPEGPVCVDYFVDKGHVIPPFSDIDEMSAASSEAPYYIHSSGPVCVDDFVDSNFANDRKGRAKLESSTTDELHTSSMCNVDVENPTPASPSAFAQPGASSDDPKQAAASSKDYLRSLGIARLLASVHIVLGHLYAKGVIADIYWFGWGFTWVPWFFMLSGYVLTHARLNSRDPSQVDGPYANIAKRLSTIFPMYAFGVFLSMLLQVLRDLSLPGYGVLIGQSFLMQSWVPSWTEYALLAHCWFLSNMVVYWAGFGIVYKWVRKLSLISTCSALAVITVLPWVLVIIPAVSNEIEADWYSAHIWGSNDSANDTWAVMLKFHPIFYAHIFIYGVLLSVLRHRVKNAGSDNRSGLTMVLSCLMRFGATFGYLGLTLVFTIVELQPSGYKLSARLSVLLPLQGLVLLGLSPLPQLVTNKRLIDPVAFLFSFGPPWIGDVSYCQYVLQFIMYNLFPISQISNASYFLYLLGASMLTYKFIQEPAAKTWKKFLPKKAEDGPLCFLPSLAVARIIFVPPLVLAIILVIAKSAYHPDPSGVGGSNSSVQNPVNGTNATSVPSVVRVAPEAIDLELNWTVASSEQDDNDRVLINPSILFRYDHNGNLEWIRAARAHAIEEDTQQGWYEGQEVTEQLLSFESSIALSREPFAGDLSAGFDEEGIKLWGLDGVQPLSFVDSALISHVGKGTAWNDLCEPKPSFDGDSSWLVRKQVSGPEDPKLIELSSDFASSYGVTFSSFPPASLLSESSSQEECKWADEAVMQMYLVEDASSLASGGEAHGTKLQCGNPRGMEKNWIAFSHDDSLYYVYSIVPHVIVQARTADGECVEQYKTSSGDMTKLSKRVSAIRGSATAIRYSETEYLALLHTTEPSIGYSTHAYTFEAKPPFAVKRISKKIPLQGGGRAFPSSLSLIHDKVIIGYGDDDKVARVYVMSRTSLEETFDWCSDSV